MGIVGRSHITISYLGHIAGVLGLFGCLVLHWEEQHLRAQLSDLQSELEGLRGRDPGVGQRQVSPGGGEDPEPAGPSTANRKEPVFEKGSGFNLGQFESWQLVRKVDLLVVLLLTGLIVCLLCLHRRRRVDEIQDSEALSPVLRNEELAARQLAEIRLRRHGFSG